MSKASRPRKRLGGGGYGGMNNQNAEKQLQRSKTFRQVNKRGKDNRQYAR